MDNSGQVDASGGPNSTPVNPVQSTVPAAQPATPAPAQQLPNSDMAKKVNKNSKTVLFILLGIALFAAGMFIQKNMNGSNPVQQIQDLTFKPLPSVDELNNCGFSKDAQKLVGNSGVNDMYMGAIVNGTIKSVDASSVELTLPEGKTTTVSLTKISNLVKSPNIVKNSGSTTQLPLSTLKAGQDISMSLLCRPQINNQTVATPSMEVLSITIRK